MVLWRCSDLFSSSVLLAKNNSFISLKLCHHDNFVISWSVHILSWPHFVVPVSFSVVPYECTDLLHHILKLRSLDSFLHRIPCLDYNLWARWRQITFIAVSWMEHMENRSWIWFELHQSCFVWAKYYPGSKIDKIAKSAFQERCVARQVLHQIYLPKVFLVSSLTSLFFSLSTDVFNVVVLLFYRRMSLTSLFFSFTNGCL